MRILALVICTACSLPAQIPPATGEPVTLATMRYIEMKPGTGAVAAAGKKFTVHYTGWLRDGKKFDSSLERKPLSFVQGRRQVIAGWEVGFEGMRVGGKRRLIIPYQLGYGELGNGTIPPKAELSFDVELLDVADVAEAVPGIDVLIPMEHLETRAMVLARSVPEAKFTGPLAAIFHRIAVMNAVILEGAMNDRNEGQIQNAIDDAIKRSPSKEQTLIELEASFAAVKKQLSSARGGFFTGDATVMGQASTRRGLLVALETQVAELLGEASVLAR